MKNDVQTNHDEVVMFPEMAGALTLFMLVLSFLVAVIVIVTIHELGHYLVGRWFGIGARAFAVGFGPVIARRTDRRGTEWRLCLLPLGGYVLFLDDNDTGSHRYTGGSFHAAGYVARMLTILAGPAINLAFAILIFAGLVLHVGIPNDRPIIKTLVAMPASHGEIHAGDEIIRIDDVAISRSSDLFERMPQFNDIKTAELTWHIQRDGQVMDVTGPHPFPALIGAVQPASPAERAGLQAGDTIVQFNDRPVRSFSDMRTMFGDHDGSAVTLRVWRDGIIHEKEISPRQQPVNADTGSMRDRWMIGVSARPAIDLELRRPGVFEAVGIGASRTWHIVERSASALVAITTGAISTCAIRGPVSIAEASSSSIKMGPETFIGFIAVLSAAIGFMNLLPFGPLDGGQILIQTWTALSRKPDTRMMVRLRNIVLFAGFLAVGMIMSLGIINDFRCS